MKQHEIKSEKEIGGVTFYIRAFPAFTAANISGELAAVLAPAMAGIVPLAAQRGQADVMNIDVSQFSSAMAGLSGDKVEILLKKLLTKYGNISIETDDGVKPLDNDLANEVFCGDVQNMFVLAFEVIRANFGGFFENLAGQFGLQKVDIPTMMKAAQADTEN
ncbi:MAG: hypothetical protein LBU13_07625 [Synergistaceae bacterium]|jgi:hypothetical protein|nr:hypothetical protein [Synergistaceae bacterium]